LFFAICIKKQGLTIQVITSSLVGVDIFYNLWH
jgi:hypothetical protein